MHTYSTDNDLRPKVLGGIGVVSYLVVGGVDYLLSAGTDAIGLGIAVGVPSWGLLFGVIFALFNRRGWKTKAANRLGAVTTPDFNGEWSGWIETSYDGDSPIPDDEIHPDDDPNSEYTRIAAQLDIQQTWWKMGVHLETTLSSSDSEGATVLASKGRWTNLSYQYLSDPPPDAPEGMQSHYGTANLEYRDGGGGSAVLEGVYYTGPRRRNYGKMRFTRVLD